MAKRGVAKGSRRIPEELRHRVSTRIREAMKPYVKAQGEWAECREAASSLGITTGAVYCWYNGKTLPTIGNLVKFADLYEVSLDWLFGRHKVKSMPELRAMIAHSGVTVS